MYARACGGTDKGHDTVKNNNTNSNNNNFINIEFNIDYRYKCCNFKFQYFISKSMSKANGSDYSAVI